MATCLPTWLLHHCLGLYLLFRVPMETIQEHLSALYTEGAIPRVIPNGISVEAIFAVGFRVDSPSGIQFRKWATATLSDFAVKGYLVDHDRLAQEGPWSPDYFEYLLEELDLIRKSSRAFPRRDWKARRRLFWRATAADARHVMKPYRDPHIRPHIFSEDEILRVLAAADRLGPHSNSLLRREVYRLAVVLLYTTGMRRRELAHLTLGDYSPIERTLLIRASKFHKSRILPLSADGAREMEAYLAARHSQRLPADAGAPLLVHGKRGGYSPPGVCQGLRGLFRSANVRSVSGALPRVHDLRHTFAVHALLRWYREAADIQVKLPYLSAYMGHVSIASTEYYLPFISPLAEAASAKFENLCGTLLSLSARKGVSP